MRHDQALERNQVLVSTAKQTIKERTPEEAIVTESFQIETHSGGDGSDCRPHGGGGGGGEDSQLCGWNEYRAAIAGSW